jgi:hypothetical protein
MFGKKTEEDHQGAFDVLSARVAELEGRCAALSEALAKRDALLEALALEQRVLSRRLDQANSQSEKAVSGLLERVEAVRTVAAARAS